MTDCRVTIGKDAGTSGDGRKHPRFGNTAGRNLRSVIHGHLLAFFLILGIAAPAAAGTITINKVAVGGDATFNFTGSLGGFGIATSGSTGQRVFSLTDSGSYTVTESQLDGWALTDLQCTDPDNRTSVNLNTRTATIDVEPGENVICTFTNRNVRRQTLDRIRTFLHRRADLLLEADPDRSRLLRRLSGPNVNQGTATPFNLITSNGGHGMIFSTSLNQLANFTSEQKEDRQHQAPAQILALGQTTATGPPEPLRRGIDIWMEGRYTGFDDDTGQGGRSGYLGVLSVGVDGFVSPGLLLGVLAQADWAEDNSAVLGSNVDGTGWMAGPYLAARLADNLFFDARGAWGTSDNNIELTGVSTDSFETERWLATARLTGNLQHENIRISPTAAIKYIREAQKSFTNSLGIAIPGQSVTLGRLSFGAEVGYRHQSTDGTMIEPFASITGLWDFDGPGALTTIADTVTSPNPLRAKVKGGVGVIHPNGARLRASGTWDGIGDGDFSAYGANLLLTLPMN